MSELIVKHPALLHRLKRVPSDGRPVGMFPITTQGLVRTGKSDYQHLDDLMDPQIAKAVRTAIHDPESDHAVPRLKCNYPNELAHWYELRLTPYPTVHGVIEFWGASVRDITADTFAQIFANELIHGDVPLAVLATDAVDRPGIIVFWNAECGRSFGYSEAQVIGQPITLLKKYDGKHHLLERIRESTDDGKAWKGTVRFENAERRSVECYSVVQKVKNHRLGFHLNLQRFNRDDLGLQYSPDFRAICVGNRAYTLTSMQAKVIRVLHQAHDRGLPSLSQAEILTAIESGASRVRDLFRNHDAWRNLIVPGPRKGTYCLNIA